MSFTLSISSNATNFFEADLFESQEFFYDVSFYDDAALEELKIPFYTSINIPLTSSNKSVFGYNPIDTNVSSFPKEDYHFIISYHNSIGTEVRGILTVDSIEYNSDQPYIKVTLKDYLSLFFSKLSEKKIADILTSSHHTSRHTIQDFIDTTANGGEAGTVGVDPDLTRIVNFPYVDLANEVEKFGYEFRQFTEYGSGETRSGFIPTISVKNYLKQLGTYLTTSSIPVSVKSKLFGINESESIPDFQPSKLQAVIPAKLQAKVDVNTRSFIVNNRFDTAFPNEDMTNIKNIFQNNKLVTTRYYGSYTYFGHYGTTPTGYNPIKKYALEQLDDSAVLIANDTSGEKGYISPHTSFGAKIKFESGNRTETINTLTCELPVVDEDKVVYKVFPNNSTMKFALKLGVFVDGYLTKSLNLNDSNGDRLFLYASSAVTTQSNTNKDNDSIASQFSYRGTGISAYIDSSTHTNYADALQWTNVEFSIPDDETLIDVIGDSRYGICYYLEPVDGYLDITYVSSYFQKYLNQGVTTWYSDNIVNADFYYLKIRKAITKISNYSDLNIQFEADRDFSIYYPNDEFVIKDSINNTCDIKATDFIDVILKRFGCGLFYEYDGTNHILRIDPIHLLRTSVSNLDYYIDDLNSIKVSRPIEIIKNLIINNIDDNLFYDKLKLQEKTIGSTTQELNENGINDFKIDLKSSVYYKSLCGEENFLTNENVRRGYVKEADIGFTKNLFTGYKDFSIRFAYIDNPLYQTTIKVPYIINNSIIPDLYTETQRLYRNMFDYDTSTELSRHVFNGRLFTKNTAGWSLLAEDELENTTDYYDLIVSTEQLRTKQSASIEFNMVVPVSNLNNSLFMFSKGYLSLVNNQSVLIKEANGQVYNDYAYLNVKGLIE